MRDRDYTYGDEERFIFPDDLDNIKPEPFKVFCRILKDHKLELDEEVRESLFESIVKELKVIEQ